MRLDPRVPADIINAVLSDTAEMRRLFNEYLTSVYNPLFAAARVGDGDTADEYLMLGSAIAEPLAESIDELLGLANAVATGEIEGATQAADNTFILLIVFAAVVALISIAIALYIPILISRPLATFDEWMQTTSKEGNITWTAEEEVELAKYKERTDEIGRLTSLAICLLLFLLLGQSLPLHGGLAVAFAYYTNI